MTAAYLLAVGAGSLGLSRLEPVRREAVLRRASTNLDNLRRGRLDVLASSAVVLEPPVARSLTTGTAVLLAGELAFGARRAGALFAAGHVLASLAVAGLLGGRALPGVSTAAVRSEVDVGLSYGALSVAGALAATRPHPALCALPLAALVVRPLVRSPSPTSWGHLMSALIGLAGGTLLRGGVARRATAEVLE